MRFTALRLFLVSFLLVSYSGCATILSGTHQNISVDANVKGATVETNGYSRARTPCVVTLSRWHSGDIVVSKEGYFPKQVVLERRFNVYALLDLPWFLLGVVPGVVAVGVDIGTGAIWEYEPRRVFVDLARDRPEQREPAPKRPPPEEKAPKSEHRDLKEELGGKPAQKP